MKNESWNQGNGLGNMTRMSLAPPLAVLVAAVMIFGTGAAIGSDLTTPSGTQSLTDRFPCSDWDFRFNFFDYVNSTAACEGAKEETDECILAFGGYDTLRLVGVDCAPEEEYFICQVGYRGAIVSVVALKCTPVEVSNNETREDMLQSGSYDNLGFACESCHPPTVLRVGGGEAGGEPECRGFACDWVAESCGYAGAGKLRCPIDKY